MWMKWGYLLGVTFSILVIRAYFPWESTRQESIWPSLTTRYSQFGRLVGSRSQHSWRRKLISWLPDQRCNNLFFLDFFSFCFLIRNTRSVRTQVFMQNLIHHLFVCGRRKFRKRDFFHENLINKHAIAVDVRLWWRLLRIRWEKEKR